MTTGTGAIKGGFDHFGISKCKLTVAFYDCSFLEQELTWDYEPVLDMTTSDPQQSGYNYSNYWRNVQYPVLGTVPYTYYIV